MALQFRVVVKAQHGQLKDCLVVGIGMQPTLALFGEPVGGLDHQSFETPSWDELKD